MPHWADLMLGQISHCTELTASQMPRGCLGVGGGMCGLEFTGTFTGLKTKAMGDSNLNESPASRNCQPW